MSNKIERFQADGLWNRWNIRWNNINPQMNIIVGINGSGKTTLLNILYDYYTNGSNPLALAMKIIPNKLDVGEKVIYLKSLDNYTQKDKRKRSNALLQELEYIVYQNKENFSFFNYRMSMLDHPEKASEISRRINDFLKLVNEFFMETGKELVIRESRLVFVQGKSIIELEKLSSGEKQLLLILLNVFLLEGKTAVVFMDEPEIALHVSWQYKLLDTLTNLNPEAQFIVTTHSPSIFGNGWGSKVVYMEDILEKA